MEREGGGRPNTVQHRYTGIIIRLRGTKFARDMYMPERTMHMHDGRNTRLDSRHIQVCESSELGEDAVRDACDFVVLQMPARNRLIVKSCCNASVALCTHTIYIRDIGHMNASGIFIIPNNHLQYQKEFIILFKKKF